MATRTLMEAMVTHMEVKKRKTNTSMAMIINIKIKRINTEKVILTPMERYNPPLFRSDRKCIFISFCPL